MEAIKINTVTKGGWGEKGVGVNRREILSLELLRRCGGGKLGGGRGATGKRARKHAALKK